MQGLFFLILFSLGTKITPQLQKALNQSADKEYIRVNIKLSSQIEVKELKNLIGGIKNQDVRRNRVVNYLKNFASEHQKGIIEILNKGKDEDKCINVNALNINEISTGSDLEM